MRASASWGEQASCTVRTVLGRTLGGWSTERDASQPRWLSVRAAAR
jgi:hypothetical protein